ncbi:nucleoside recognition domain-containing protein [Paraclostridium benzoelyticum]|uniref:nucleoside recognition domain-containing protein n=1 Tax=Paraclostridium benzoelyticum TaxID=1629550 RepID=UPI0031CD2107
MSKDLHNASITPDNLNDSGFIDSIKLTKDERKIGIIKFLIFSAIAIMIFFIPIEQNGKHNILFGIIYNAIVNFLGVPGFWYVAILITGNAICSLYGKYIARPGNKLYEYYKSDSKIHPILYLMAAIFMVMYCLQITIPNMNLPQIIVGNDIGGVVIPDIVIGVAWIIPVGAFFVPFLLNYGSIDFFGVLLEPLMRPLFKVPGKSAVDATASFVGSTSMSIIITSRLFKNTTYTKKNQL